MTSQSAAARRSWRLAERARRGALVGGALRAVAGRRRRAVATGETVYADGRRFSNLFVLRFDGDGRCSEFVEWYIENPAGA